MKGGLSSLQNQLDIRAENDAAEPILFVVLFSFFLSLSLAFIDFSQSKPVGTRNQGYANTIVAVLCHNNRVVVV